jgi:hypothetical protein
LALWPLHVSHRWSRAPVAFLHTKTIWSFKAPYRFLIMQVVAIWKYPRCSVNHYGEAIITGPPFPTHCFANIHSSFATIYTPLYFNYTHLLTLITGTPTMLLPPRCHYLTVAITRKPWLIPRPYILMGENFGVFMGERSDAKILTACLILYSSSAK